MTITAFNPATTAKLDKMVKAVSKNGISAYSKYSVRQLSRFRQNVDSMQESFDKIKANPNTEGRVGDILDIATDIRTILWDDMSFIRAAAEGDFAKAWTLWARWLTQNHALHHLTSAMGKHVSPRSHAGFPKFLLGLQSIGWEKEAYQYCEHLFTQDADRLNRTVSIIPEELFAWISIYFTLGSRDLIAQAGFKEPNKPDSIYSTLLGDWQDKDIGELSETLLRYGEYNVEKTLLPPSKRPLDLDYPDLLFIPFDILAVNMRRKTLGLSWVETSDPRVTGWPVSTDKMPLVKDNVTWPIYLELCHMAGVSPFSSQHEIEITLDPETLDIME